MSSFSRPRSAALASVLLALAAASVPFTAFAEEFNPLGDGSGSNNADLLRDTSSGCENCPPMPPHEWDAPPFDLEWSVALRGAYVQATGGSYFEAQIVPTLSLRRETMRGGYSVSASADIARSTFDGPRIEAIRGALGADYQLDANSTIGGAMDFAVSQASAKAPGTSPTIASQPLVVSGDGEIEASRQFGQFVVTGRGSISRTLYGETTLTDTSIVDNSHQSSWTSAGGLRLGYMISPVLTAFVDASMAHQTYDAVSPTYLVKFDATDYQARTGLSAAWSAVLEAEASVGYGLRQFDEAVLGQSGALLYDASITYRPDETVEATGSFATTYGAPGPDSGGTARLEYAAAADLAYTINPWLTLRTSAGASYAQLIGTVDTETEYSAGVGADYRINELATATADYGYTYTEATASPPEDEHRITLGVTISR